MKIRGNLFNLKPVWILWALLSCQNFYKSFILIPSHVTPISSWKMTIEWCRIELCQDIYFWNVAIQAVANRNINQPVIGSQWNCWFCSFLCQWVQPGPGTTSQYNSQNTLHPTKRQWIFIQNFKNKKKSHNNIYNNQWSKFKLKKKKKSKFQTARPSTNNLNVNYARENHLFEWSFSSSAQPILIDTTSSISITKPNYLRK